MNSDSSGKQAVNLADLNARGIFPVLRSRKARERDRIQAALYRPCPCGSGRKFKFCCHAKGIRP
jgi:hypothetical protein